MVCQRTETDNLRAYRVHSLALEPNLVESIMKIKKIAAAIMAISFAASGMVLAKDKGDREDRREDRRDERRDNDARNQQDRRDADADMRRHRGHADGRGPDGRGPPGQLKKQRRDDDRREGRGFGPNHSYYRGDRLPMEYRHYHYVVTDWRSHQLSAPARGQQWVQYGGDYVLITNATGVIASLISSR